MKGRFPIYRITHNVLMVMLNVTRSSVLKGNFIVLCQVLTVRQGDRISNNGVLFPWKNIFTFRITNRIALNGLFHKTSLRRR